MPGLQAQEIVRIALRTAKAPNFTQDANSLLNAILAQLCQENDFDAAKQAFNFTFTGATAPIGNLNAQLASGPFKLPVDYLRAKIGDILYFPQGLANFPLKLTPIDLAEFDALVQQAGFQNFPVFWTTDMSAASPMLTTTGNTNGTTTLSGLASTTNLGASGGVAGPGIVPGTTFTFAGGTSVTLSRAVTSTGTGGSYTFGTPPIAYVWPPASGGYPCLVRYYSQMPDIATPSTSAQVPWFPNSQFLITELAGRVMQITGDDRWEAFLSDNETLHPGGSRVLLRRYLQMKDDSSNRAQRVRLDPRRFGPSWSSLPKSKVFGY